jgi:hypothetical protein
LTFFLNTWFALFLSNKLACFLHFAPMIRMISTDIAIKGFSNIFTNLHFYSAWRGRKISWIMDTLHLSVCSYSRINTIDTNKLTCSILNQVLSLFTLFCNLRVIESDHLWLMMIDLILINRVSPRTIAWITIVYYTVLTSRSLGHFWSTYLICSREMISWFMVMILVLKLIFCFCILLI